MHIIIVIIHIDINTIIDILHYYKIRGTDIFSIVNITLVACSSYVCSISALDITHQYKANYNENFIIVISVFQQKHFKASLLLVNDAKSIQAHKLTNATNM